MESKRIVSGTIVVAESAAPIEGLLVEAALPRGGVDSRAWPESARRLGSTQSDAAGRFTILYETEADLLGSDLVVRVLAPDGDREDATALFVSKARREPGAVEEFAIRLNEDAVGVAGVPLPGDKEGQRERDELRRAVDREERLAAEARTLAATRLAVERETMKSVEPSAERLLESLSTVSKRARRSPGFVERGEDIGKAVERVAEDGRDRAATTRVRISVPLTEERRREIASRHNNLTAVPLGELDPEMRPEGAETMLLAEHPAAVGCRDEQVADHECLRELNGRGPAEDPEAPASDPDPSGNGAVAGEGVGVQTQAMVDAMRLPEDPVAFHASTRPDVAAVTSGIQSLELGGGPADVPAYHDFHALSIAFDDVWTEVFDQDVVDYANRLYRTVIGNGGNVAVGRGEQPLLALRREVAALENLLGPAALAGSQPVALAMRANDQPGTGGSGGGGGWKDNVYDPAADSGTLVDSVDRNATGIKTPTGLLAQLQALLRQEYAFTVFAADKQDRAINFGLVVTYRQRWEPLTYQAGNIVETITLAPGETRKFTSKRTRTLKRSTKELNRSLRTRSDESSHTSRAEADILRAAEAKTNFNMSAEGSYNAAVVSAKASTAFGKDAGKESRETKKSFREAVLKAAQEYKNERSIELSTEAVETEEETASGEVRNQNEELSLNCVFFELQRRYRVSEEIHKITPVVLVAQEVPDPSQITDGWIVAHDWILKRALLDDSFAQALELLSTSYEGDKAALAHLRQNVEHQRAIVNRVGEQLRSLRTEAGRRYDALARSIETRADLVGGDDGTSLDDVVDAVLPGAGKVQDVAEKALGLFGFGGGGDDDEKDQIEAARIREEAARDAFERAERQARELHGRVQHANNALQEAVDRYTVGLQKDLRQRVQIVRLRLHIKQNILYYMQAIWAHEPPDQRFFRLHQTQVPVLDGDVQLSATGSGSSAPRAPLWDLTPTDFEATFDPGALEFRSLVEVADLDQLLGYKGNYMMFPMRESNALTDFMMLPYLDGHSTLRDPDDLGNWTVPQFADYVCCLRHKVDAGELGADVFERFKPGLREQLQALLTAPRAINEIVTVPSGSLYMELLPGNKPLLEDFKLAHRAVDVKKAQAEVRQAELENLRMAARLLASGEHVSLLEDPEIDRKVIIEGQAGLTVPLDE